MQEVTINDQVFKFRCDYSFPEKVVNEDCPGIKLSLMIFKDGEQIKWEDFKNSYPAEKISQFIKNTINGQRTFHWKSV